MYRFKGKTNYGKSAPTGLGVRAAAVFGGWCGCVTQGGFQASDHQAMATGEGVQPSQVKVCCTPQHKTLLESSDNFSPANTSTTTVGTTKTN